MHSLEVSRETTPTTLIANASAYATHLKPYTMRNQAVNFQTEISKACSDWVVYYSSVTEVWGFFLFFYFIALFFFFYFIVPKSIPHYRLNTNLATPVSWLSSFISCGVPFFLIFTILYESTHLLFTGESFPLKASPLILIEGCHLKYSYRLICTEALKSAYAFVLLSGRDDGGKGSRSGGGGDGGGSNRSSSSDRSISSDRPSSSGWSSGNGFITGSGGGLRPYRYIIINRTKADRLHPAVNSTYSPNRPLNSALNSTYARNRLLEERLKVDQVLEEHRSRPLGEDYNRTHEELQIPG